MAELVGLIAGAVGTLSLAIHVTDATTRPALRAKHLLQLYGPFGIYLFLFGNRMTWRLEAQVLGRVIDQEAEAFKKSIQEQCSMVSVAAAIVAQIAITGLMLSDLSRTHWVARGFLVFSLIAALTAVYYATTLHRITSHLLKASQVRLWIRGGNDRIGSQDTYMLNADTIRHFVAKISKTRLDGTNDATRRRQRADRLNTALYAFRVPTDVHIVVLQFFLGVEEARPFLPQPTCDPEHFRAHNIPEKLIKYILCRTCFSPSISAVITISAPQVLLSMSLFSLLIALAIYFGFTWTRGLDAEAGENDSRNVFIMYVTGLAVCLIVYTLSRAISEDDKRPEAQIMEEYMKDYIVDPDHTDIVEQWGISYRVDDDGRLHLSRAVSNGGANA